MRQASETLLALVNKPFRPERKPFVNLSESSSVVLRQLDTLPEFRGGVCPLDGLHAQVKNASIWMGANGGVTGIGERARLTIAKTSDIVFIAAEILILGSP